MTAAETKLEETFRLIFQDMDFPFLSVDQERIADAITKNTERNSHVGITIDPNVRKEQALKGAFRGMVRKLNPPQYIIDLLSTSEVLQQVIDKNVPFRQQVEMSQTPFIVTTQGDKVLWEENSFWPLAYSTFIQQLVNISSFYRFALTQRFEHLSAASHGNPVMIAAEHPRHMPTIIHYAFASIGAWLGGALNIQFFSQYATAPQIRRDQTNRNYCQQAGYSEMEATALTQGGIIAIPATLALPLLTAQGDKTIFGSLPLEEFNPMNWPAKGAVLMDLKKHHKKTKLTGFIIDKYYRTPFFARKLNKCGLLGANDVLRDHYTEFYNSTTHAGLLRCKHYCAPIIEVTDQTELKDLISRIPERGQGGLFFRGQTSFYPLERSEEVKKLLFADSTSVEPSLRTSAARQNFDYDRLHFSLKHFFGQEMLHRKKSPQEMFAKWRELSVSPLCEYDLAIMAMAQHYGLPTNGLDVTTNIDVATWFATNKFMFDKTTGIASYKQMEAGDWNEERSKWPVVFIFQTILHTSYGSLQDCREIEALGVKALRPERQNAKFFLGGHSDHQNRLAESLICAVRLKPNNYSFSFDFNYLFPPPEEDQAYQDLLLLSRDIRFTNIIESKINVFHR